jgi:hypothetical protein
LTLSSALFGSIDDGEGIAMRQESEPTSMPTPAFIWMISECVTGEQIRATIEHNRFRAIHI